MNKPALLAAIHTVLSDELEVLTRGARTSFAAATDPDSRAENKYDTRTLEASYVARGQAQRVTELQAAVHQFQALSQRLPGGAAVQLGSLVTFHDGQIYFVGPAAGGTEVIHEGEEVLVITPASPLGQKLMGRKAGETLELRPGVTFRLVTVQ